MSARTGQKYKMWRQDDMDAAIDAVNTKTMSINAASKAFSVPKSTLSDKTLR